MIKYEKHNIKVYLADCIDIMSQYPDGYFDLSVIDPPYGIKQSGSKNHTRCKLAKSKDYLPFSGNDLNPPDKDFFVELKRVSKNQIIFGANHFIQNIPDANSSAWIVWDKANGFTDFADCELAYTSFNTAVRRFSFRWQGMLQGNMKNKEIRIHPTQKPIALYAWIYNKYTKPGQKILDTHLGSGSNAIAAYYAKIGEFVGCELNEYYFKTCTNRIESKIGQLFHTGVDGKQVKVTQQSFIDL
jgi:site-specific DNA-methyltransferase (adenine-specific)